MRQFKCVSNSSFSDTCVNTYGSMDYYVKGLIDNGIAPNDVPYSGQPYVWDDAIVRDQSIQQITNTNNIIYATLFGLPNQPNIPTVGKYSDTRNISYTASANGETVITLTALQGAEKVIQIEKEIKPLLDSQYIADLIAGTITLTGGLSLAQGETLAILFSRTVTY
ncbi:MAG: hypothetical protein JWO03_2246 [Bacteroidetes bacterium]|nr:hypothetical protein [Bacteroidota bacterium]